MKFSLYHLQIYTKNLCVALRDVFFLKKNSNIDKFNPIHLTHRGPDDFQTFKK